MRWFAVLSAALVCPTLASAQTLMASLISEDLAFEYTIGGPPLASAIIRVTTSGGPLPFTVSVPSIQPPDISWLTFSPASGVASKAAPVDVTVTFIPSLLSPRPDSSGYSIYYSATLNITSGAQTVSFGAGAQAQGNALLVYSPASLSYVAGAPPLVLNAGLKVGQVPEMADNGAGNAAGGPGPFAAGSLLSVFGDFLINGPLLNSILPIPVDLGGFSATIDGQPTRPFFVNRNQANLQLPYGLTAGRKIFVITVNGIRSVPYFLEITDSGPGVFTYDDGRRAVAQNVSNTQNYTLNSAQDPIRPGGVLIVYITGQGELDVAIPAGAVAPSSPLSKPRLPVRATIGGRTVRGTFVMTPGLAGVLQSNLEIDGLAAGEQELIVYVGEVPSKPTYVYIGN